MIEIKLPTGSKGDLAEKCPPSMVYPWIEDLTTKADDGKIMHSFLEICNTRGEREALAEIDSYNSKKLSTRARSIDLSRLPIGPEYQAEVAFLYDVLTGESTRLGSCIGRNYPKRTDSQICLTVDVLCVDKVNSVVHVYDYKTGRTTPPRPTDAFQTNMGALAVARYYDCERAVVYFIHIPDFIPYPYSGKLDEIDLAQFANRLKRMREKIIAVATDIGEGKQPSLTRGSHCTWCPAYDSCPAQRQLAGMVMEKKLGVPTVTSRGNMGKAWMVMGEVRALLDRWTGQMYKEVERGGPITLPNGKLLEMIATRETETLDGKVVHEVMRSLGYPPEIADMSVTQKGSKAALSEALRARGVKNLTRARDEVLDEVRKRKGSTKSSSTKLGIRPEKKGKK